MSEEELRRGYDSRRILIEASRVLSPSFNAQGIYLTGAQVEMLRNVVAYLNRRPTWVDTYSDTYYIMADDSDYSDILEIVADLEVKLMSNENTLWGYNERYAQMVSVRTGGAGTQTLDFTHVPAGEVWVIEAMDIVNLTGSRNRVLLYAVTSGIAVQLHTAATPLVNIPDGWQGRITLQEGDWVRARQFGCQASDAIDATAWGYKMIVPE